MKVSLRMDSTADISHNKRIYPSKNSRHNPELTKYNISLIDIEPRKAYKAIFDDVIADYNNRQKRKDRLLDYDGIGYYNKVMNTTFNKSTKQGNKTCEQHPYYEMIVQIGDKDERPDNDTCIQIFKQYLDDMQKRSQPHMTIIGAYIHLDESTPHMHIDYIPLAQMKKGMSLQVGLNKCFEQMMDYKSKNAHDTAQQQFQARERELFRELCISKGLDIDEVEHNQSKHLSVTEYKAQQIAQDMELIKAVEEAELSDTSRQTLIQKLTKSDYVTVPIRDYNRLKFKAEQAQGLMDKVKAKNSDIRQLEGRISKFEAGIDDKQQALREREQYIKSKESQLKERIDNYNRMMTGEPARQMQAETERLLKEYQSLKPKRDALRSEISELQQKVSELKSWLKENIITRLEKQFINSHRDEFETYVEQQKSRGRSR